MDEPYSPAEIADWVDAIRANTPGITDEDVVKSVSIMRGHSPAEREFFRASGPAGAASRTCIRWSDERQDLVVAARPLV